jgi:hypothetical protein
MMIVRPMKMEVTAQNDEKDKNCNEIDLFFFPRVPRFSTHSLV